MTLIEYMKQECEDAARAELLAEWNAAHPEKARFIATITLQHSDDMQHRADCMEDERQDFIQAHLDARVEDLVCIADREMRGDL